MGSFASCDGPVPVSNGFRSCFYSLDSEEFCVELEQYSPSSPKKNVNEVFFGDVDSSTSEEEDFNDSIVKELGILICDTLHIHEYPGSLGVGNPALNQDNICKQIEAKSVSFDTDVPLGLSKCAPIQCSELVQSYPVNSDADGLLPTIVINQNNSKAENLACVQQLQTTTTTIIPALKGSRALYGKNPNTKLNVKWAPDVYDPPTSSSSHTVKGPRRHHHHHHHQHQAKSKKDHHNHKYSKGKSSRSTSTVPERKHATNRRSSLTDPRISRLQALGLAGQF